MSKKQLIMNKALELFADKGIEATSVQQITEQCGISKGAFYLSFKSKDELVLSIIDLFMQQISADIDQVVRRDNDPQTKLYEYYLMTFKTLERFSTFGKAFIREQTHTLDKEFFEKLNYYDNISNRILLQIIEELYGENVEEIKYDLLFTMMGVVKSYVHLFLFSIIPLDLDLLSKSLVEKTNILAKHAKLPFMKGEMAKLLSQSDSMDISITQIVSEINILLEHTVDPIERESLNILREQLQLENCSLAIINGLLYNLQSNDQCKWLIYLVRHKYPSINKNYHSM